MTAQEIELIRQLLEKVNRLERRIGLADTLELASGGGVYTNEEAQDAVGTILTDTATIDFTYTDATPSITADVINDSITFAKMQNIATDSLIGRDTASTGDPENILLNATLEMDGAGSLRRAALTGDVTASAGSNTTAIGASKVLTAMIADAQVTLAKMANLAQATIIGRASGAGTGVPTALTAAQVVAIIQSSIDHGGIGGLSDDDHAQYALLAGRSGGQTLYGDTAANGDITIHGTSNATRTTSYVLLQPTAGNVGIGTSTPASLLDVDGIASLADALHAYSASIAHGMTTLVPTDVGGRFVLNSFTEGGTVVQGFTDVGTRTPLTLMGVHGSTTPTVTIPGVRIRADKKSGTTSAAIASTEMAFEIVTFSTSLLTVMGNGNTNILGALDVDSTLNVDGVATISGGSSLLLDDPDVAHGLTVAFPLTSTYGRLVALSGTNGGLLVDGVSDADATGLFLRGTIGVTDPTDSTPAINLRGGKKNTTDVQALGSAETVLRLQNGISLNLLSVLGDGKSGFGTTTPDSVIHTLGTNAQAGGWTLESSAGTDADRLAIYPAGNFSVISKLLSSSGTWQFQDSSGNVFAYMDTPTFCTVFGAAITPGASGALAVVAGTSSNDAAVGGSLYSTVTATGNVTTGEDTLATYTVPANTLSANNMSLRFEAWGTTANNANAKTIKVKFDGVIFGQRTMTTSAANTWVINGGINRTGAATQTAFAKFVDGATTEVDSNVSLTSTLSNAIVFLITGEGTSTNDIILYGLRIWWEDANT